MTTTETTTTYRATYRGLRHDTPTIVDRTGSELVFSDADTAKEFDRCLKSKVRLTLMPEGKWFLHTTRYSYVVEDDALPIARLDFRDVGERPVVGGSDERKRSMDTLLKASRLGQAVAVLMAILGVLGGIGIATIKVEDDSYFGSIDTHPYIGLGIGIGLITLFTAAVIRLLAVWAEAWYHATDRASS
jgi:hypothetical protein